MCYISDDGIHRAERGGGFSQIYVHPLPKWIGLALFDPQLHHSRVTVVVEGKVVQVQVDGGVICLRRGDCKFSDSEKTKESGARSRPEHDPVRALGFPEPYSLQ